MASAPQNTPILVRKPDGTFVKMTLAELSNLKKQPASQPVKTPTPPIPAIPKPTLPKPMPAAPVERVKSALPTLRPKPVDNEFSASLLEEALPAVNNHLPTTSPHRHDESDSIIDQSQLNLSEEKRKRLRSAIQLKLKDIRTGEQTLDALVKPWEKGGVGVSQSEAVAIMALCGRIDPDNSAKNNVPALKNSLLSEFKTVPQNIVAPTAQKTSVGLMPAIASIEKKSVPFKIHPAPLAKTVMHDVLQKTTPLGPVEEIQLFSLTDFRRLAPTAAEAASRLKQKFINLKEESIILLLSGIEAWRQSPLYLNYTDAVKESISLGRHLGAGAEKQTIQLVEIKAITEMEKQLDII